MRAVSTVLDVSLFLLLVGAAVGTLALADRPQSAGPPAASDPADELVERLATSTVRVNYSLAPAVAAVGELPVEPGAAIHRRSAHGSYAELLAGAAVASATVEGDQLTVSGDPFARAVARAVEATVRREGVATAVRASWRPYPNAAVSGVLRIGDPPPPDADVRSATVRVDSGLGPGPTAGIDAGDEEEFGGVAAVLANRTLDGLFPARTSRVAVRGAYPTDRLVAARYITAGRALEISGIARPDERTAPARDHLRDALRTHFERDLRARYSDPGAAARDVEIGRVTVLVRTWSR